MVKIRNVVLCLFGLLLLSALAVETATQIYTNSRSVDSWSSLVEKYFEYREQYGPIVPPSISYEDVYTRMQAGDFSFLAESLDWQFKFDGGSYYIDDASKLAKLKTPLHILILEDIQRGEIFVLSSTDGKKYKGEALFSAPEFTDVSYMSKLNLTAEDLIEEQKMYAFEELAPRRVIWHVLLKHAEDALSDIVLSRDIFSSQSVSLMESAGVMMTMSVPAEHTNDLWIGIEGTSLTTFAPEGFTNRVEIYATTDLVSNIWTVAVQNLMPVSTNPATWASTISAPNVFFRAGNMDIDSDGDTLPDAREMIVHKTDSERWDTDGDWLSDGWETTNSLNALVSDNSLDSDGDGLSNIQEYQWGINPNAADSDGDGMPDSWESQWGTDPGVDDASEDPDGDGLGNDAEFDADTNPLESDTDEDGIPDGFEAAYGMNPLNSSDVMTDLDGDLVPNFYEYMNGGTDPLDIASVPVPTAIVSTNGHDDTFTNIQNAIDSVLTNEYPIIFIEPGSYSVTSEVDVDLTNVLICAASGTVVLDGGHSNRLFNLVSGYPVLAGLVIQNGYSPDGGGAVYVSEAKPLIFNCFYLSNLADGDGGAIFGDSYAMEVANCVFEGNEALNGGAVYCENNGQKFKNCTWFDNHAQGQGGAVCNGSVVNGVIWGNHADLGDSQVAGGATVSYSCVEGGYSGEGNTTNDPQFVYGWHLSSLESPCVNSGDASNACLFDLDGDPRDALPDMGADEWGDSDVDGLPDWWEIQWFGSLNGVTNGNLPAADSDGRFTYIQKYEYELTQVS